MYVVTRRWFRRLWVVQELCLARRASFFLREHKMEAETVFRATKLLTAASSLEQDTDDKA